MKFIVKKYISVDSTNNIAIRRIRRGHTHPTFIIADYQKKGRGQYGKKWISSKGNIFITFYFKINKKNTEKKLTKTIYTNLKNSLNSKINEKISIKLPNDLLIKGSKICGILQETVVFKNKKFLIVGIGINLSKSPKLTNLKTSYLQKYAKYKLNKKQIIKMIIIKFEKLKIF